VAEDRAHDPGRPGHETSWKGGVREHAVAEWTMTCRRASEIDLPGFLADPSRPEYDAFRAHYPRCRECAAEVRAWTELREALRAARSPGSFLHPEPEQLARYEEAPAALGESERRALEAHLAGCVACRDELRALRAFDPAALAVPSRSRAPTPERERSADSFLAGLRRLLWHPALAYALLLALVVPTVYRQVVVSPSVPPADTAAKREEPQSEMLRREVPSAAEQPQALREQAAASPQRAAPPEVAKKLEARAPARSAVPAAPPSAGTANTGEKQTAEAPAEAELRERDVRAATPGLVRPDAGKGVFSMAQRDEAADLLAFEVPASTLVLRRDEVPIIAPAQGALQLSVTFPRTSPDAREVEVRVVGPDGRRELRERRTIAGGAGSVSVEIPAGWLVAGRHEVELSGLEAGRVVDRERYAFEVRSTSR
jgi:hypothetical protein